MTKDNDNDDDNHVQSSNQVLYEWNKKNGRCRYKMYIIIINHPNDTHMAYMANEIISLSGL